jgi:predicted membrane channel-forming protein YqfA (hemolysin III family)
MVELLTLGAAFFSVAWLLAALTARLGCIRHRAEPHEARVRLRLFIVLAIAPLAACLALEHKLGVVGLVVYVAAGQEFAWWTVPRRRPAHARPLSARIRAELEELTSITDPIGRRP